jgi:hypothetical protein
MAKTILNQVVEFDKSAGAWAQLEQDGAVVELRKYHDSQDDAILAALPADLHAWVLLRQKQDGDGGSRALKAAALIANAEIIPDQEAYGIYHVAYRRKENGVEYEGVHVVDARRGRCSCEDHQYKSSHCKHILGARFLFAKWQAEHMPRSHGTPEGQAEQISLWELAQAAVAEHRHDDGIQALIIWQSGTRSALLSREIRDTTASRIPYAEFLRLEISGQAIGLRVAMLRYGQVDGRPIWEWVCRQDEYKAWVAKMQAPSAAAGQAKPCQVEVE